MLFENKEVALLHNSKDWKRKQLDDFSSDGNCKPMGIYINAPEGEQISVEFKLTNFDKKLEPTATKDIKDVKNRIKNIDTVNLKLDEDFTFI